MTLANLARFTIAAAMAAGCSMASAQSLDYDFYKTKVEPIFYKHREGHARCVVCHSQSNNSFSLQEWGADTTAFTEEQSRANFAMLSKLVNKTNPDKSILLLHPLAKEGGGQEFHSGGKQFPTKDDPDWQILNAWAHGAK
jgi:hypothetical protein